MFGEKALRKSAVHVRISVEEKPRPTSQRGISRPKERKPKRDPPFGSPLTPSCPQPRTPAYPRVRNISMRRSTEGEREDRDVIVPPEELIIETAGYGRWQILITAFLCLTIMCHMMNDSLEPIHFMTGWWCEKPEILRSWTNSQWITFSHVNGTHRGMTEDRVIERFRGCHIYEYNFAILRNTRYEERPHILNSKVVKCARIHYSRKFGRTIAEKYDKGCDPSFQHSLWHFLTLAGESLGYLTFGCLSDRVGRRPVLFVASGMTPVTGAVLAFSPSYVVYLIARTFHGFFHGGFVVSFIMLIEITNNIWRTRITALGAIFYALGVGITPMIFRLIPSIDRLVFMTNLPYAVLFVVMIFVPESPAWLFCTRASSRLNKMIRKAARVNGTSLPNEFRVTYVEYTDVEKQLPKQRPGFWKLLQAPEVACEVFAVGFLIALSGVIYGSAQAKLIYNEKRIDRWYSIIGLVKMSGIIISQFCVLLIGHRKLLHVAVFLILVTTGALMVNLREDYSTSTGPATTILAANVLAVSLSYGALLNYSVRTVPTLIRGAYLGMWNSLWTVFTWLGTRRYINYPGISSTAVITILLAALATLNIRDLLWRELPDTLNDAVNFKDKPKPKRWTLSEMQVVAGR